jgi:hypothetical protein
MLASKNEDKTRDELMDFFSGLSIDDLQTLKKITEELLRARELHPSWPEDSIHQAAIVQEEAGELIRAALQHEFDDAAEQYMDTEAIQTAAMALRFLLKG